MFTGYAEIKRLKEELSGEGYDVDEFNKVGELRAIRRAVDAGTQDSRAAPPSPWPRAPGPGPRAPGPGPGLQLSASRFVPQPLEPFPNLLPRLCVRRTSRYHGKPLALSQRGTSKMRTSTISCQVPRETTQIIPTVRPRRCARDAPPCSPPVRGHVTSPL